MNTSADSLLRFAKIAEITYDNPDKAANKFKELNCDIVKFFDIHGAQAYLLIQHGTHVLSFRGTELKEPSDILADLTSGKNFEIDKLSGQAIGKVHVGFKKELDKLWPEIEKYVTDVRYLYVTGHSLGAAMATIAASRLHNKTVSLITFGSPRVGTKDFVENCKFLHYRVQNNCDDVTKVPLALMGFKHHGIHVYLDEQGIIRNYDTWQMIKDMIKSRITARGKGEKFIGLTDHFMANYIKKLSRTV